MRCPDCGFDGPENASFCGGCGSRLGLQCPSCGAANGPSCAYCVRCGLTLGTGGEASAKRDAEQIVEAERRQLTIMFVDLVGSTPLSTQLEPEDLRILMRRFQATCVEAIEGHEGYISRFMGDGILVYFGFPAAAEDDAERAIRAGLDVISRVRHTDFHGIALHTRVGITTGLVVIGDVIGSGSAQEHAAVGQAPNLAARLQALAEPDRVVVSDNTRQIVGRIFEYEDLGPQQLKGFPKPMRAWRVLGPSDVESRFDARRSPALPPMLGRSEERDLILARWSRTCAGDGQAVLLHGDAGIGKSRLVEEIRQEVRKSRSLVLCLYCAPHHESSELYPVSVYWRRVAGISPRDTPAEQLIKLEAPVAGTGENPRKAVPLLSSLLSIPLGDRYAPSEFSAAKQRELLLATLSRMTRRLASRQPLLLVLEDAHWSDPTTRELLELLVQDARMRRMLVVVTHRPGFTAGWDDQPHVTSLRIANLGVRESRDVVRSVAGSSMLDEAVVERIADRADGVPLYLEELTRTVLQMERDADDTGAPASIPATLRDSLTARLDRAKSAKEIAQTASAIGNSFDHALLRSIADEDPDVLSASLRRLVRDRVLRQRGDTSSTSYMFAHALIRDVAYDSLLRSRRQEIHRRIGDALSGDDRDLLGARAEQIAHHYSAGDRPMQALRSWLEAGQLASRRSASVESLSHLANGLRELERLAPSDYPVEIRDRLELDLRLARCAPLVAVSGWVGSEIESNYRRARELCDLVGGERERFDVRRGMFNMFLLRADLSEGGVAADELAMMAEAAADPALELEASRARGVIHFLCGDFNLAREWLDRVLDLYDPASHGQHTYLYGTNPAVVTGCWRAWTDWFLGRPDEATLRIDDVIETARRIDHPFSLGYSLCFAASIAQCRRDPDVATVHAGQAIRLADAHGFVYWKAWGSILSGWARVQRDDTPAGIEELELGLAAYEKTGARQIEGYALTLLADGLLRLGRVADAADAVGRALAVQSIGRATFYKAEGYRLTGEIGRRRGDSTDDVQAQMLLARECASSQGSLGLSLRAELSLVEAARARQVEGYTGSLLHEVLTRFDTSLRDPDLQAARSVLESVSGAASPSPDRA